MTLRKALNPAGAPVTVGSDSFDLVPSVLYDSSGNELTPLSPSAIRASTATYSSVNSGTSSVTLLALNTARKGATIVNTDANVLYVDCSGGTATASRNTHQLMTGQTLEVPFGYTGAITGMWAADGSGVASIVEFT